MLQVRAGMWANSEDYFEVRQCGFGVIRLRPSLGSMLAGNIVSNDNCNWDQRQLRYLLVAIAMAILLGK